KDGARRFFQDTRYRLANPPGAAAMKGNAPASTSTGTGGCRDIRRTVIPHGMTAQRSPEQSLVRTNGGRALPLR
ncbi:MAG: hypothetical protein LBT76_01320, partial [Tannerella sp.]|nr:hypothetical protein [Tannerella sp.]